MQYRENVLLWPKSDEIKKSLVLFYLFTLWCIVTFAIKLGGSYSCIRPANRACWFGFWFITVESKIRLLVGKAFVILGFVEDRVNDLRRTLCISSSYFSAKIYETTP